MSEGFPHELAAALDGGPDCMDSYVERYSSREIIRDIHALCGTIRDNRLSQAAVDRRDYFAATATEQDIEWYIPATRGDVFCEAVKRGIDMNTVSLNQLMVRLRAEARYRHADAMMAESDRKIERPSDGRQD